MKPLLAVTAALLSALAGCGGPSSIKTPRIDAAAAARQAMELYDKNGDGILTSDEIDADPCLKQAADRLQAGGQLTADDLEKRFRSYYEKSFVMTGVSCQVTLNNRPLSDASVVFEPAAFLGDPVERAIATTDARGVARPVQPGQPGLYLGAYRVQISKIVDGKESIPARFNEQSVLGAEVAQDGREITTEFKFELKSP